MTMAEGTSNTEAEERKELRFQGEKVIMSWLPESDRKPFGMVLAASEEKSERYANSVDIRNSINFLEGFLERTNFPDDEEAAKIKTQIDGLAGGHLEDYDELRLLRADYAKTMRGDITNRLDRLKAREADMIGHVKTRAEAPKVKKVQF